MLRPDQILPVVLVVVMAGAGAVSMWCGKYCDSAYYFCGAGLNLAVILKG